MARQKGVAAFPANFEPEYAGPLDARAVVATKADLVSPVTWQANDGNVYVYRGMVVSVVADAVPENNGLWCLAADDYTVAANWEQSGGGGGDLESLTTQEILHLTVDYATGEAPPPGLWIRTQAEFDALGVPLKYMQDVLDVLPPYLAYPVRVTVLAGNQYARDVLGPWGFPTVLATLGCPVPKPKYKWLPFTFFESKWPLLVPGIIFRGETEVVEAAVEVVFSHGDKGAVGLRSSGSWTAHALKGQYVNIISGAMAGADLLIRDNDETNLYLASRAYAVGASTLNIERNVSRIIATLADGTPVSHGIRESLKANDIAMQFRHLVIFPDPSPRASMLLVNSQVYSCSIRPSFVRYDGAAAYGSGYVMLGQSIVDIVNTGVYSYFNADILLIGIVLTGYGRMLDIRDAGYVLGAGVHVEIVGVFSSFAVYLERNVVLSPSNEALFITGNGTCTGLALYYCTPALWANAPIRIDNCATAVSLVGGHVVAAAATKGVGNTTVWRLTNGATLQFANASTVEGQYINLDGQQLPFGDISERGTIVGRYGATLMRW